MSALQTTTKADIVRAVSSLPEDATVEDAIERLVLLHKVEIGLAQARRGEVASLSEVEARLQRRRASKQA